MRFETPQQDIDECLAVEATVKPKEMAVYLDWMNGVPFSTRVKSPRPRDCEGRDVRDGCILTRLFERFRHKA